MTMPDKVRTPTMPTDKPGGARSGDGRTDGLIPADERGAGGGGPIGPKDKGDEPFHGGQSDAAYHGHGRLGEDEVEEQSNPNAVSEEP